MLHPRFFLPPDSLKLRPEQEFNVIWYAQVDAFTLVHYKMSYGFDGPNGDTEEGEILYKNNQLIFSERLRQEMELGEITAEKQAKLHLSPDPRTRISVGMGRHGISPCIAQKLRSPKNRVSFRF